MKNLYMSVATVAACLSPALAHAQNHDHHTHHDHGAYVSNVPASVMGDHTHAKGSWMFSYRPMFMKMNDNRDGTNDLSLTDISGSFAGGNGNALMIVPTEMEMTMHMFSAMYAPTDRLTLMVMGSYQEKDMDLTTFTMGSADTVLGEFSTSTQGWGDTKVAALYQLADQKEYSLVGKLGLSLPTGSIDEEADVFTPMMGGSWMRMRTPYSMQLGSGTYDLEPAVTYTHGMDDYSWGAQYMAQIHTGRNSQGYTLGDKHRVSVWGGYQINNWLGSTLRLSGEYEGKIDGQDDQITGIVQTANPDYYGGKRADVGLGFNITPVKDSAHGIGVEATLPVYQNLNGPQMKRDYGVSVRYSYSF